MRHLLFHGTGTIDDVRATVDVPVGIDPKAFGPVPSALAKAGIIHCVGFANTTRAVGHARLVRVWELVDPVAALVWLVNHPEPSADPFAVEPLTPPSQQP